MGKLRLRRDMIVSMLDEKRREVDDIGFRVGRLFRKVSDVEGIEKQIRMHKDRLDEMKLEYAVVRNEYYPDVIVEIAEIPEADVKSREEINEVCLAPVVVNENRLKGLWDGILRVMMGWFEELEDARRV